MTHIYLEVFKFHKHSNLLFHQINGWHYNALEVTEIDREARERETCVFSSEELEVQKRGVEYH